MGKQGHQLCREPARSGSRETGPARDYTPTNNIIFFHAPGSFPHSKMSPNTAIPMVVQCCYHGQSPPITTNHPPITSEIYDQSPSNHLKITSTGTTNHRPVTSTEHETFSLFYLSFFRVFFLAFYLSFLPLCVSFSLSLSFWSSLVYFFHRWPS